MSPASGPSPRSATRAAEVESLEAERDFLLQSLDDLDAEHAAGNVDDETFETLHDDYTARTAAVVRALRDGVDTRPTAPPMSTGRRLLAIGGVVVFAAVAAISLAAALGVRLPGQEVTGSLNQTNAQTVAQQQAAKLQKAAAAQPNDAAAQLASARNLYATGQYAKALPAYSAAAKLAPADAESRAYIGWILYLANLPGQAAPRLQEAETLNAAYPDTHFFQGMVLLNYDHQAGEAVLEFQKYLALAPGGALAGQAQRALGAALSAAAPTATTVAPSTTTTR